MTASTNKALAYLKKNKFPLLENNVVLVKIDDSCEMAEVSVNDQCVMMGNFWDFHPGCHGIKISFSDYESLATALSDGLTIGGHANTIKYDQDWSYEEEEAEACEDE